MTIKVYNRTYEFKDGTPEEVLHYFKERVNEIPKDVYYKYIDFWPGCKKFVVGECDISGKETKTQICKLKMRKYNKDRLIHPSAIMKATCELEEWKNVNSEAQLIAQNKPGQREKNSQAVKKVWQSDKADSWREAITKHNQSDEKREKISKASTRLWQDDDYRKMMLDKFQGFQGVSGTFYSKYSGELRFDSTYELFYAFFKDLEGVKLERFPTEIRYYLDDVKRGYRPDFIVENNIIEIKSDWVMKNYQTNKEVEAKQEAAEEYIKTNSYTGFELISEEGLNKLGPFEIKDNIIYLLNSKKHILIKHGKIKDYKRRTERYIQAEEYINKWNSLK